MKRSILALQLATLLCMLAVSTVFSQHTRIKNVVLVHGAFLDGSGWEGVFHQLVAKGYNVTITQHTLRSLEEDTAAVNRVLDQQDGPVILVGHSYGGVIITASGNHPKVAGLVYIAAHAPDANEHRADLVKTYPSAYTSLIKGKDGFDYLDPAHFPADFAADLPREKALFMAHAQMPTADKCFQGIVQQPAWRVKPSWYMVAEADRIIHPGLERFYAKRAQSKKVVEIKGGSHAIYASRPKEVAALIEDAAKGAL
ncbi:pimeloyl-ACP methyl ester carboxylesterase [Chitinophaga skermanii]|uniref:Pimeloyl-ACP methyl ester carboxylesterase n=1 Tax=Chitinophaga skermanii TaxID=331697 RepID=A0A327QVB0_9BACT|nr:alpha/beta hydrolase [Chitinophaga skermanii]RAJ08310.1 pimeloyl-ACP methyl ester carboxylesterase [Chitinophaga skermanii]